MTEKMEEEKRRVGPVTAAILVSVIAVAMAFYLRPYAYAGQDSLLASDEVVRVERGRSGIAFLPASGAKATGFVFYAGAKVPPEAYAYLGRACARAGYVSVLPSFPLGLAILDKGAASKAFAAHSAVGRWVVGGHSLGGAMAASFITKAARDPAAVKSIGGLFLVAAYPGGVGGLPGLGEKADLSSLTLPSTCVSAANDGLATPDRIAHGRLLMPAGARFVEIAGGNHAQFGEYGAQSGDGAANIGGQAQRAVLVEEALSLLGRVEAARGPVDQAAAAAGK
jgi:hypothetical protein